MYGLRLQIHRQPVALFGGGHVGRSARAGSAHLPFDVLWVDSRGEIFPTKLPANVRCEHSDPIHAAVGDIPAQSRADHELSHAEDLDVVASCLLRQDGGDLAYVRPDWQQDQMGKLSPSFGGSVASLRKSWQA